MRAPREEGSNSSQHHAREAPAAEAIATRAPAHRLIAGPRTVNIPWSVCNSTLVTAWLAAAKSLAGCPAWSRPAYFTVALPCGAIVGSRRTYAPFTQSVGEESALGVRF